MPDQRENSRIPLHAIDADVTNALQLPFLGELTAEGLEVLHEFTTCLFEGFLGGDVAVCLHAELEVRK